MGVGSMCLLEASFTGREADNEQEWIMTKPFHILAFAAASAVVSMGGCTQQYNGSLSFKDSDAAVIGQAREYHASKQGEREDGLLTRKGETDASPSSLHSMGPVKSVVPQQNPDSAAALAAARGQQPVMAPAPQSGTQFTAPANTRPEVTEPVIATNGKNALAPLGLFGDLPERSAATGTPGSPLDSPGNVDQITFTNEGSDFDPEVDATGKHLLFASTRHRDNADIYVQKIGGTTVTQLTNDPAKDIMPTFSPDGASIAFASDRSGNWDIYLMDISGGKATQITNGPTHDLHPSFSPDGRKLVYCSYGSKSGQWELVVIDVANPAQRQIIGNGLFPQWSPSGDRIVFQRSREKGTRWFSVWTIDYVDGEARRATEIIAANNAAAITPTWSPDGNFLAFSTVMDPDGTSASAADKPVLADVWVVALDGSSRANLTNNKYANLQPTWSKSGAIYFVSNRGKDGVENVWSLRPDSTLRLARPTAPTTGNTGLAGSTSEKAVPTAAVETKE